MQSFPSLGVRASITELLSTTWQNRIQRQKPRKTGMDSISDRSVQSELQSCCSCQLNLPVRPPVVIINACLLACLSTRRLQDEVPNVASASAADTSRGAVATTATGRQSTVNRNPIGFRDYSPSRHHTIRITAGYSCWHTDAAGSVKRTG